MIGDDGLSSFDRLRYRRRDATVVLYAFDLLELNGDDLRRASIEQRKAALTKLLSRSSARIQLNEHVEEDGALVFDHACKLGFEVNLRPRQRVGSALARASPDSPPLANG